MSGTYESAGYGSGEIGFGTRPAILVVDFQTAFIDPKYPLGGFPRVEAAVEKTAKLLEVARRCGVPVAACYTGYHNEEDMPRWKIDAVHEHFFIGHPSMEIDPRVHDADHDFVFRKTGPSIFFNTPLMTFLTKHGVDTTIVTGCVTSGCIRASVIDSFSYGYRTIVAEDCCGDSEEQPHLDNLRDMDRRYADISSLAEVTQYLEDNRKRNAA